METSIPKTMKAVLIKTAGEWPDIDVIPVPQPGPGEVLIRMVAAPINPSDLGFLRGSYGFQKISPIVPGFEGSGIVVAAGAGIFPRLLLGKRVACMAVSGGTWAEYLVTKAFSCFPLPDNIPLDQGAMMSVNPLTALAFFRIAKREKHAAIVNTAAAGALGRMIFRLGLKYKIPVINIVRNQEQEELLRSLSAEFVLRSDDAEFGKKLRQLAYELKATLILDAVGGQQCQLLINASPPGSTIILYGNLSDEHYSLDLRPLGMEDKKIMGFFLGNWLKKRNFFQKLADIREVQHVGATVFQSAVQKKLPLSEVRLAIELYRSNMTSGKVLLIMDTEKINIDK